jgi:hypothetical protein
MDYWMVGLMDGWMNGLLGGEWFAPIHESNRDGGGLRPAKPERIL